MTSTSVRSISGSILTHQVRRTLRACRRAQELHRADVIAGLATPGGWSGLSASRRAEYRAAAEAEMAAPPQFPRRADEIGRDQVTRLERARVFQLGGIRA